MTDSHNNEDGIRHEPDRELAPWVAPTLGLIIVGIVVGVGLLYLWGSFLKPSDLTQAPAVTRVNNEPETPRALADVQSLQTVSPSDELHAIHADIESTQLDTLDTEVQGMDSEVTAFETKLKAQ